MSIFSALARWFGGARLEPPEPPSPPPPPRLYNCLTIRDPDWEGPVYVGKGSPAARNLERPDSVSS